MKRQGITLVFLFGCASTVAVSPSSESCFPPQIPLKAEGPIAERLTLGQAVDRAIQHAISDGRDFSKLFLQFDDKNSWWNQYSKIAQDTNSPRWEKLAQADFLAVYFGRFSPLVRKEEQQTGGDLWIFVDRKNGQIIDTLKGK